MDLSFCVACLVKAWVGEFRNIHDHVVELMANIHMYDLLQYVR